MDEEPPFEDSDVDYDDDHDLLLRPDDASPLIPAGSSLEMYMNVDTQPPGQPGPASNSSATRGAIAKIEAIFEKLADSALNDEKELCLRLPARPSADRRSVASQRALRFPGKTAREAWRFTAHIRVLELMHEALVNRVMTTKRDMFYKDPALFVKQSVVDRLVDDISFALSIPRMGLNVVAAAKGLVAGHLTINRADGTVFDSSQDPEGSLIPMLKDDDTINIGSQKWILVIEKEAVFRSLLCCDFWATLSAQGIFITGKGYPDIASRALLKRLASAGWHDSERPTQVYGLADYDPDGIAILSTYKHGSASLQYENEMLQVSSLQWLGLRSRDIVMLHGNNHQQGLLPLSLRDRRKASKMLEWQDFGEEKDRSEWRTELQIMLLLNCKAEIELLDTVEGGVGRWLAEQLGCS